MNNALTWMTLIATGLSLVSMFGLFGTRIVRALSALGELPRMREELEKVADEIKSSNAENVRRFTIVEQQILAINSWQDGHLSREHGFRKGPRNG